MPVLYLMQYQDTKVVFFRHQNLHIVFQWVKAKTKICNIQDLLKKLVTFSGTQPIKPMSGRNATPLWKFGIGAP